VTDKQPEVGGHGNRQTWGSSYVCLSNKREEVKQRKKLTWVSEGAIQGKSQAWRSSCVCLIDEREGNK
jgi:hypothetical protein